jgi:hypothetical protein
MFALTPRDEFQRLSKYRTDLFAEIKRAMSVFDHWKPCEGEIKLHMPGANETEFDEWQMEVYCYVASDGVDRRFKYFGKTLTECVEKAEADLVRWKADTDKLVTKSNGGGES